MVIANCDLRHKIYLQANALTIAHFDYVLFPKLYLELSKYVTDVI